MGSLRKNMKKMVKMMMMLFLMIMMKVRMEKVMKMVLKMKKMRRKKLKTFTFELASWGEMVSYQIILAICLLHDTNFKFLKSALFLCDWMNFCR